MPRTDDLTEPQLHDVAHIEISAERIHRPTAPLFAATADPEESTGRRMRHSGGIFTLTSGSKIRAHASADRPCQ